MSKRIEQLRNHGPSDPRDPTRVRLVTPRNQAPVSPSSAPATKRDAVGAVES
jgi:hypothetical protein